MKTITYKKKIYYNPLFVKFIELTTPLILFFLKTKIKSIKGKITSKGPALIAAHHERIADQYIINKAIKRRLFWIADITEPNSKKSLADKKFIKWLMLRIGSIPIDKHNPKRNTNLQSHLLWLLKKQQAIVFFPEAYLRSERKTKFGKFKDGIIKLALAYKKSIPIYPIGIKYKKEEAYLTIGNPIYIKSIKDKNKVFNKIKLLS